MSAARRGECRRIFARLSEYLDRELPADACDELEHHFDGCAPCHAFLESLRRTVRLVESLDGPPLPDDIRDAVHAAHRRLRDSGSET